MLDKYTDSTALLPVPITETALISLSYDSMIGGSRFKEMNLWKFSSYKLEHVQCSVSVQLFEHRTLLF